VIVILASGETWKGAASILHISPWTVDFHIRNARRKIHASNALAVMARLLL
jgi:DNA-binding CsgD family transcriptional regulator